MEPTAEAVKLRPKADKHMAATVISGIDPSRVAETYRDRRLAELSDRDLFRACISLLADPKRQPDSFTLHAPLEVMARYRLLPLVQDNDRELARMQMLAIAVKYQAGGESVGRPTGTVTPSAEAVETQLREAVEAGDVERTDKICTSLVTEQGLHVLLRSVADLALETLTAATHTHIGLMHLARVYDDAGPEGLQLARMGLRALAQEPLAKLKPVTKHQVLKSLDSDLQSILSKVPSQSPSVKGVRATIEDAEQHGLIEDLVGDALLSLRDPRDSHAAARAACRIAALSMLCDSAEFPASLAAYSAQAAKFIWTHCLTMPQAAWMLTGFVKDSRFAAEAAHVGATWVIGFRYCYGNGALALQPQLEPTNLDFASALAESPRAAATKAWFATAEELPQIRRALASESAVRSDAHLVKYVRACMDAVEQSPPDARLFYAAAAYLCSIWCREESREQTVSTSA